MELTQEEITTGNQLIADFMQPFSEMAFSSYYYMPQHSFINCKYGEYFTEDCFRPEEMSYNSSWDWLIPVVEKIESIGGQQVFINGCSCNILGEKHETIKSYGTKLEATYKAVVQFIKWYNQQK